MAKLITQDKTKAKEEAKRRKEREAEEKARDDYLVSLNKSKFFKKYVVDEIIDSEIKKAENIEVVPDGNIEEMGKLLLIQKALVRKLKTIRSRIVGEN